MKYFLIINHYELPSTLNPRVQEPYLKIIMVKSESALDALKLCNKFDLGVSGDKKPVLRQPIFVNDEVFIQDKRVSGSIYYEKEGKLKRETEKSYAKELAEKTKPI